MALKNFFAAFKTAVLAFKTAALKTEQAKQRSVLFFKHCNVSPCSQRQRPHMYIHVQGTPLKLKLLTSSACLTWLFLCRGHCGLNLNEYSTCKIHPLLQGPQCHPQGERFCTHVYLRCESRDSPHGLFSNLHLSFPQTIQCIYSFFHRRCIYRTTKMEPQIFSNSGTLELFNECSFQHCRAMRFMRNIQYHHIGPFLPCIAIPIKLVRPPPYGIMGPTHLKNKRVQPGESPFHHCNTMLQNTTCNHAWPG